MSLIGWLSLILCAFLQAAPPALLEGNLLSASEKTRLAAARKLDDRIKVYEAACRRMQQTVHRAAAGDDFSPIPVGLEAWTGLLAGSLEDIEANLQGKKKSRALIRYEIRVRKTITEFRGYKARAPVEQQDVFDLHLARAEEIRKRFVDLIFQ